MNTWKYRIRSLTFSSIFTSFHTMNRDMKRLQVSSKCLNDSKNSVKWLKYFSFVFFRFSSTWISQCVFFWLDLQIALEVFSCIVSLVVCLHSVLKRCQIVCINPNGLIALRTCKSTSFYWLAMHKCHSIIMVLVLQF